MSSFEGVLTFLFTDIERSAKLWEEHPEAMGAALARHDALLRRVIERYGGHVFKTMGDAVCAAFGTAPDALAAALEAQIALQAEAWGDLGRLRVRVAVHTGAAEERDGDYFGPTLNRVARVLAAAHGGQILLSATTAERARAALPRGAGLRDLGVHRLRDLADPEHLFQLLHPDLPADFPPLRSLEAFAHNLPVQLTRFIGREREMAEVKDRLATTRLLTLTGAGGCGKTRLALQVAADLVDQYADGVWLVELAALADPMRVPQAVASALGVREEPGRAVTESLVVHLRSRSLLLLVDNCEHLVDACARLADALLQGCPRLRVLATSREPLGIRGELAWRVPSLSCPVVGKSLCYAPESGCAVGAARGASALPTTNNQQLTTFLQYESVHLFVDRAFHSHPGFAVTDENAPAVAQVCRQLDGIPLAIELAAARVKVLSVEQIASRLDDRFRLLTGGSRTVLPRQQTLRAAIDWSYDLLSEAERLLLLRLSVFAGGWRLEAAEAVCADESIESWEVLDLLSRLVDKSLVVVEKAGEARFGASEGSLPRFGRGADSGGVEPQRRGPGPGGGEARYHLLETIRQYGLGRLEESGRAASVRRRHAHFFLRVAEEAEPELHGAQQISWCDRLDEEHDNLRAALAWCRAEATGTDDREHGEIGLQLTGALWWFWNLRGYFSEGQEWVQGMLATPSASQRTAARAKALEAAGGLALFRGDHAATRPLVEEAVAIWRELGDRRRLAYALRGLGWVMIGLGDESAARSLVGESLAIYRELGDKQGIAKSLLFLGHASCMLGDYGAARALWEEALTLSREVGDQFLTAWVLNDFGKVAEYEGDYGAAGAFYRESLAMRQELGYRPGIALCLEALARVALTHGEPVRSVRLFAAGAALRAAIGAARLPDWLPERHADHERELAASRAELGEDAFASAWAAGWRIALEQAIAEALEAGGP